MSNCDGSGEVVMEGSKNSKLEKGYGGPRVEG
jgi:hypothetical protein